jgi:hypothetical protein
MPLLHGLHREHCFLVSYWCVLGICCLAAGVIYSHYLVLGPQATVSDDDLTRFKHVTEVTSTKLTV